jgi:NADH dehydrogenase
MRPVPRVVIIGGGFAGVQCARKLRGQAVDVLLVDRHNFHLFTPLLYQVASCLLNPSEIAIPLRRIIRDAPNVHYREGEVEHIDLENKVVHLADGDELRYDHVVIATGSATNYRGNRAIEEHTLGLKDLAEALQLRNHVLECLERASATDDVEERRRVLTFTIVGGGPTGVEYAGALAELVRLVLPREYPEIPPHEVQIVLLEGSDHILPTFAPSLGQYAMKELRRRGVDIRLNTLVASADATGATTHAGHAIPTETLVWTAGVLAGDVPVEPNVAHDRMGRYVVDDHLRVVGADGAFAIGDVGGAPRKHGHEAPMLAPPAMQQGRYVARQILKPSGKKFRYFDKGTMATIGRTAGLAQIGRLRITGFLGWITWLFVHIYYLIGFQNRVRVLMRWGWYYLRLDRPVRIILRADPPRLGDQGE